MFSGIIQSQGKIKKLSREKKSLVVEIHSSLKGYVSDKWESYLEVYSEIIAIPN